MQVIPEMAAASYHCPVELRRHVSNCVGRCRTLHILSKKKQPGPDLSVRPPTRCERLPCDIPEAISSTFWGQDLGLGVRKVGTVHPSASEQEDSPHEDSRYDDLKQDRVLGLQV